MFMDDLGALKAPAGGFESALGAEASRRTPRATADSELSFISALIRGADRENPTPGMG